MSFAVEHAADAILDAQVYHLTERDDAPDAPASSAPKLDAHPLQTTVDAGQELISAKTDGFSIYVVQLTYGSLSHSMPFGAAVPSPTSSRRSASQTGTPPAASASTPQTTRSSTR